MKIKAVIDNDSFVSIFYNAETGKHSYTLLKHGKRLFGADNTRTWHIHPFENPDTHAKSRAIFLEEFLNILLNNRDKW